MSPADFCAREGVTVFLSPVPSVLSRPPVAAISFVLSVETGAVRAGAGGGSAVERDQVFRIARAVKIRRSLVEIKVQVSVAAARARDETGQADGIQRRLTTPSVFAAERNHRIGPGGAPELPRSRQGSFGKWSGGKKAVAWNSAASDSHHNFVGWPSVQLIAAVDQAYAVALKWLALALSCFSCD